MIEASSSLASPWICDQTLGAVQALNNLSAQEGLRNPRFIIEEIRRDNQRAFLAECRWVLHNEELAVSAQAQPSKKAAKAAAAAVMMQLCCERGLIEHVDKSCVPPALCHQEETSSAVGLQLESTLATTSPHGIIG